MTTGKIFAIALPLLALFAFAGVSAPSFAYAEDLVESGVSSGDRADGGVPAGADAGGIESGVPIGADAGSDQDAGAGTDVNQAGDAVSINAVRRGTVSLESPINCGGQPCSIPTIIARLINFILAGVGAVAVIMLIYAGITYMTSAGNEKRIESAKKTMTYTVLGLAVVFLSFLIVSFTIALVGG